MGACVVSFEETWRILEALPLADREEALACREVPTSAARRTAVRDAAFAEFRKVFSAGEADYATAVALHTALCRYVRGAWRQDQVAWVLPLAVGGQRRLLHRIMRFNGGSVPSISTIRRSFWDNRNVSKGLRCSKRHWI